MSLSLSSPISSLVKKLKNFAITNDFKKLSKDIKKVDSNYIELKWLQDSICEFSDRIVKYIAEIEENNKSIQNSEIKALQAQINPHFMYNTLDAISWKCLQYDTKISDTISNLSEVLRYSIKSPGKMVYLQEEIEILNSYLSIIQYSQRKKINVEITDTKKLKDTIRIPKITLQPIIENSILHGLTENSKDILNIKITIDTKDENVIIKISDDGTQPDIQKMNEIINSNKEIKNHGIKNVHKRLQYFFNYKGGLTFEKNELGGCTVYITLPFIGGNNA